MSGQRKAIILHLAVLAALFAIQFMASDYVQLSLTRIMVFAVYASGFNLIYGYGGLLSLGHAMFFGTGLYVAALGTTLVGLSPPVAFFAALLIGGLVSVVIGAIVLRATGVSFMIVTLMFSQAAFLTVLYFGDYTRGDEGIVIGEAIRRTQVFGLPLDLTSMTVRYNLALALLALTIAGLWLLVGSSFGRVLVAIRENEARTSMLGYDVARHKLIAFAVSGLLAAVSGAAYALLFAYAGASLASIQYSINPLLWTLMGGASTLLGPVLGTGLMTVLIDLASQYTSANLLAIGVVLILLVLFFPKGLMGTLREKFWGWLP